jgi:hypothetical protein
MSLLARYTEPVDPEPFPPPPPPTSSPTKKHVRHSWSSLLILAFPLFSPHLRLSFSYLAIVLIIHTPLLIGLYEVLGPISCSWHASHPPLIPHDGGGRGGGGEGDKEKEERDLSWNESFRENKRNTETVHAAA